jgi:hypothetical protein
MLRLEPLHELLKLLHGLRLPVVIILKEADTIQLGWIGCPQLGTHVLRNPGRWNRRIRDRKQGWLMKHRISIVIDDAVMTAFDAEDDVLSPDSNALATRRCR